MCVRPRMVEQSQVRSRSRCWSSKADTHTRPHPLSLSFRHIRHMSLIPGDHTELRLLITSATCSALTLVHRIFGIFRHRLELISASRLPKGHTRGSNGSKGSRLKLRLFLLASEAFRASGGARCICLATLLRPFQRLLLAIVLI